MNTNTQEYRIYIASLSDYNAGRLHGCWIDLEDMTLDDVQEKIQGMLSQSPEPIAEEWAIHDYELPFHISEYEDIQNILDLIDVCEEFDIDAVEAFLRYDCTYQDDPDQLRENLQERYRGAFDYELDYAREYIDMELACLGIDLPASLPIDEEQVLIDLQAQGFYFSYHNGSYHVFDMSY